MTATETGIDVLDCRFPIEWTLQSAIWRDTIRNWDGRPGFVLEEVSRATEQDTQRRIFPERRFVQAEVDTVTLNLRDIEAAAPYPELAPKELAHDWDTQPGRVLDWTELAACDD